MEEPTEKEIKELKKTYRGMWKLWRKGVQKFKEDPPLYRIYLMQGIMVKLTMYMIVFACIYAVSVGLWIFALIILPVGTIGNYYSMQSHFMKYKDAVKQYEMAGILKPINEDISALRRRWRIIESKLGFLGLDIMFIMFTGVLSYAYFADITLWYQLGIVLGSIPILIAIYLIIIYKFCLRGYNNGT